MDLIQEDTNKSNLSDDPNSIDKDQTQNEWDRLAAMIAEAKRHEEIAKAQKVFEPVYREIEIQRSRRKNSLKLRQTMPSVEDVAIARGIIRVLKPSKKPETETEEEKS